MLQTRKTLFAADCGGVDGSHFQNTLPEPWILRWVDVLENVFEGDGVNGGIRGIVSVCCGSARRRQDALFHPANCTAQQPNLPVVLKQ